MDNHNADKTDHKHPRILVADDTDVNQKIAQLILQKSDYRVDIAENGQQALEAYRRNRYDLILMDIQMPFMDGHEATQKIRNWENEMQNTIGHDSDSKSKIQNPKSKIEEVPIIAMTGNATAGSFDETLYPGMNDCIGKPLQRDLLLSVVQKWIKAEPKTQTNENSADETPVTDQRPEKNQFPLDLDRAIQEFMGQKEILLAVLQTFINSAGPKIDTIRQAVKGADYDVIGSEAHAIKGAAANLTADRLARLAADLEQAAEDQQPNRIGELADKLEREFHHLENYVQQNPEMSNLI
jgi:CheY-like chemotaxis protein/HPt (histidine-containing phosphotransfer) domain-containing protein